MIAALLVALASSPAGMTPQAALAQVTICNVHDGDSVRLCSGERVRIADIDAPELRGSDRCRPARVARLAHARNPAWCDYRLGIESRDELRRFLAAGPVTIRRFGKDAYGRTLALLAVNGKDAGQHLRERGLARRWR